MESKGFYKGAKVLASLLLFGQGMYYAITQPGPLDTINGAIIGITYYAIWFAQDRTK